MVGGLNTEVANQTAVPHLRLLEKADLEVHPCPKPIERRQCIVAKCLPDAVTYLGEVEAEDLQTKGFFRREVIGE